MRVALINPTSDAGMGVWQPLALGYLAAALALDGHEVTVLDRLTFPNRAAADAAMLEACRSFAPELIGLTATTPLICDAFNAASLLRAELPAARIVIGGTHATALPEATLNECEAVHAVAIGEGEYTIRVLAAGGPLAEVAGIAYRANGKVTFTGECRRARDLDDLPMPRRDLLSPEYYFRPHDQVIRGLRLRGAHIITGRGCTHRCTFCAGSLCFGPGMRFHSTERVIAEMQALVADHGIEGIYIADDVFLAKPERTSELCEALLRSNLHRKLRWCCQLRVNGLELPLLKLLRRAGCAQVEFGLESGSQTVLDSMRKRTTVAENRDAVRLAHEAGLRVFADIIVGYPGETREDLAATRQMLVDTKPEAISLNRFVPLPGSPIFEELRAQGKVPEDWSAYSVGNPWNYTAMPDEELEALVTAMHSELAEPAYLRSFYLADARRRPLHYAAEVAKRLVRSPRATLRRVAGILAGRGRQTGG